MHDDLVADLVSIQDKIDVKIHMIEKDAIGRERRSWWQRRWDVLFRATTAILAVVAPALVTYSTASGVSDSYKLAAILLSGVAGAAATLQAIFAFQQSYVRNAVDALDLYDLKAQLEFAKDEALRKGKDYDKYSDLNMALSNASKIHREIIIGRQKAQLEQSQPTTASK